MILDGDKLLHDLNEQLDSIKKTIPIIIKDKDWSNCLKFDGGSAAISEIMNAIKSGDYTIEGEVK